MKRQTVGVGITRESLTGEADPAGTDKDALEAEMMSDLVRYWHDQRHRVVEALTPRIPKDRKAVQLPLSFWSEEELLLLQILLPALQKGAEGGVAVHQNMIESMGIGIDWTMPYTEAADWARKYGGKLVRGVTRTTRDKVGVDVANWLETPGANLGDLTRTLMDPSNYTFSRSRAKLIAITETTAAYARGEMTAARELEKSGYFEYDKVWQTNRDDIVCDICLPLQDYTVQGIKTNFPTGTKGPPAHPGCRCWVNTVPKVPQ